MTPGHLGAADRYTGSDTTPADGSMRAMILAAGRGERMRPLTDKLPKPMLRVAGKPLIQHQVERLRRAGFTELVINLGWLGETIRDYLGDGTEYGVQIRYSVEPPGALETAGGIVHALALLGEAPFLTINADILCDAPLARLRSLEPAGMAHLVLVPNPEYHRGGDFSLDGDRVRPGGIDALTYSGSGVYRPELFVSLSPGVRPLRPVLDQAIAADQVGGERHDGLWLDIGTPERLQAAAERLSVPDD